MAYPVLAAQSTWFAPTISTVKRANITEIEIMDSYRPDTSVTVTDSWDASAAKDGSITCYVIGTKLIIAGNGSGKINGSQKMGSTFSGFENAVTIECGCLSTTGATTMDGMFKNCKKVESLDLSSFDMSTVGDCWMMFSGCSAVKSIDFGETELSSIYDTSYMFATCRALTTLDVSGFNTAAVKYMHYMFAECSSLRELHLEHFDTGITKDMTAMFRNCSELVSLDLSGFNTTNVTSMKSMFEECSKLSELDVNGFVTSVCKDMSFMFYGCSSLGEIDVSNWDVSNVTTFDHFAAHANLRRKGIENWKPTSATNMNALFHNCAEEELDLSGWDVSKNQFFCQMFENSPNLKRVKGLDKWNTSAGLGFDGMFERCAKLEEVDLSSFNTTKAKNGTTASPNGHKTATLQNMFLSCDNLKKVTVGTNFAVNGDGSNTTAVNKAILPTPSATYIDGADGNWYTFNGDTYAPNAMKDKTAETYYASYGMVADMDVIVKNGSMIDTAKAIREKNGTTTSYTPAQFGAAIRAL